MSNKIRILTIGKVKYEFSEGDYEKMGEWARHLCISSQEIDP